MSDHISEDELRAYKKQVEAVKSNTYRLRSSPSYIDGSNMDYLKWISSKVGSKKPNDIRDLATGVDYCQMLNKLFKNLIPLNELKTGKKLSETERKANFQLLFHALDILEVDYPLKYDPNLYKGFIAQGLEFGIWFRDFYEITRLYLENPSDYNETTLCQNEHWRRDVEEANMQKREANEQIEDQMKNIEKLKDFYRSTSSLRYLTRIKTKKQIENAQEKLNDLLEETSIIRRTFLRRTLKLSHRKKIKYEMIQSMENQLKELKLRRSGIPKWKPIKIWNINSQIKFIEDRLFVNRQELADIIHKENMVDLGVCIVPRKNGNKENHPLAFVRSKSCQTCQSSGHSKPSSKPSSK